MTFPVPVLAEPSKVTSHRLGEARESTQRFASGTCSRGGGTLWPSVESQEDYWSRLDLRDTCAYETNET